MQKPSPDRIAFDKIAAICAILAAASFDYGFRIWMLAGMVIGCGWALIKDHAEEKKTEN